MIRKKPSLPAQFLYLFGASKCLAIESLMVDLDLELVSCRIAPLPKFISKVAWFDTYFVADQLFKNPFKDVHESRQSYTQGCLFE